MDDEYPEASGYIHVSWCRSFLASNMRFSREMKVICIYYDLHMSLISILRAMIP